MAYSINPNLPKARAIALRMLMLERRPLAVVANKCGVHRSTIWRWKQKWLEINKYRQMDNTNRPNRPVGTARLLTFRWSIPTNNSAPHHSPQAICGRIIDRILELRSQLKRCAEVIWYHLNHIDEIKISLSSVHRILRRHHQYDGARKNRVRRDNPRRPHPTRPGKLVQTDTIHYICPFTYKRRYVYTVIDLHTRMAYAEIHSHIRPSIAARVIAGEKHSWALGLASCKPTMAQSLGGTLNKGYAVEALPSGTVGSDDPTTTPTLRGSTGPYRKNVWATD